VDNFQEVPAASRRSGNGFHPQFWRKRQIFLDACSDPNPEIQLLGVGGLLNCKANYSYLFTDLDLPGRAGPAVANCLNRGEGTLKVVSARALYYYPESIHLATHSLKAMAEDTNAFFKDPALATLEAYQKAQDEMK
jgi:hypothetical protein